MLELDIEKHTNFIIIGVTAQKIIMKYNDFLVNTFHPSALVDDTKERRDKNKTMFLADFK